MNKIYLGNLALLLIALGTGYLITALANKEGKNLKVLGYIIGIFVMVTSIILILNSFATIRSDTQAKKNITVIKPGK